ncbi:MAG: PAS domain S-box protein [Bacteroidales bacterium]
MRGSKIVGHYKNRLSLVLLLFIILCAVGVIFYKIIAFPVIKPAIIVAFVSFYMGVTIVFIFIIRWYIHSVLEKFRLDCIEKVEFSHNMHLVIDSQGNFKYIDPSFELQTGFALEDTDGKNLFEYLDPLDYIRVKELFEKVKSNSDSTLTLEFKFLCKNGEYITVESYWQNYLARPRIGGIVIYLKNTTRYYKIQEIIKSNKIDPCRHMNNIPVMIFSTDNVGTLISVSDYWLDNFGYSREEILGLSAFDFLTEESKLDIQQTISEELIVTGFYKNIPCQCIKRDGTTLDALLSAVAIKNEDNIVVGYHGAVSDISHIKQIEKQLRMNKEIYQKIVYTIPDVFLQCSIDGTINYVNDKGLKILSKYPVRNVIGMNILSMVALEDRTTAAENLRLMFEKNIGNIEYKLDLGSDHDVFCEVNGEVLRDADGMPYGIIFIIRDITQRKVFEKQLMESEEKYRVLVETSPSMTWEIAPDGTFTYASPQSLSIFGFKPEELYHMRIFDLIVPAEEERVGMRYNDHIMNKDSIIAFEVEVKHGISGKRVYVDISSSIISDTNGNIISLRGVAHDITSRKLAELEAKKNRDYLDIVLREGGIGLWFSNLQDKITTVDEVWANAMGYSSEELMNLSLNSIPGKLIHPDDFDIVRKYIVSSIAQESSVSSIEHRMFTKNGDIKWVLSTIKVLRVDDSGSPIEMIGFMKDITERKLAEIKVSEANAAKDKLFSIIAHDLRNPLNAVIGFSELLINNQERNNAEKVEEYSHHIYTSAINLNTLLENLLDWANTQRGMVSFNPKHIDLDAIVNEEIENVHYIAQKKNIAINSFNNKLMVMADGYLLRIIIRNLLTNAIKYSNPNSKVDIYSLCLDDYTEINVYDRGIGMSDETVSRLFSLSNNKSQRGTANERGTGLGLLVCKEFVEKHNGKIWVESKLGEGSIFTFSLPR